jgi:hypothetical protein
MSEINQVGTKPKLKPMPVGIQSFVDIYRDNFAYIDKTAQAFHLTHDGLKTVFLSRPRRFGKSLLISTLEEYFSGHQEMFKGLAIDKLEPPKSDGGWKRYPVLHFDLSAQNYQEDSRAVLHQELLRPLIKFEKELAIQVDPNDSPATRFRKVIVAANEKYKKRAVVLIDEYDSPLNQTLQEPELFEILRNELRGFYSVLKSESANIKFALLTGVSRFAGVTLFSGLNQLYDVSMLSEYSDICGITQSELEQNFSGYVSQLAHEEGLTTEETFEQLLQYYDGYDFTGAGIKVYNPFSLVMALKSKIVRDYWFDSGTPSFLIDELFRLKDEIDIFQINNVRADANQLSHYTYGRSESDLVSLLFQTGYLTIKNKAGTFYQLGYPNLEVQYGFLNSLVQHILKNSHAPSQNFSQFALNLDEGEIEPFLKSVSNIYDSLAYPQKGLVESDYSLIFNTILATLQANIIMQSRSLLGAADAVVLTPNFIYIFEFKVRRKEAVKTLLQKAFDQIESKAYARKYETDLKESRQIFKIAVVFDAEDRKVLDWKVKKQSRASL